MLNTDGGFNTVNRLLASQRVSVGHSELVVLGRPDLTVEALVTETEWRRFFDPKLLEIAETRLRRTAYAFKRFEKPIDILSLTAPGSGTNKEVSDEDALNEALRGYRGPQLPADVSALLTLLLRHSFALQLTERHAGGTINLFGKDGEKVGYINGRALNAGVFGYRFSSRFAPGIDANNAIPQALDNKAAFDAFCTRYGCDVDDLVIQQGSGSNEHRRFLILRTVDLAAQVLLQDAGMPGENLVVRQQSRYIEGALRDIVMVGKERNAAARRKCLEHYGFVCAGCNTNIRSLYIDLPVEIIHVHHMSPLSDAVGERNVDPVRDMRPVCPNCHAVIHS